MFDGLNAAVPGAWVAKLNVSVSQVLTAVVRASVSTEMVGSDASSILSRIGMFASGEYTRTDMRVLAASSGILGTASPGSVDTVVPAHSSAPTDLTAWATWLVPPAGSFVTVERLPPKSVSV